MSDLREAQLRQEFRSEIMRGYQAALCNSDVPGWTLGDEVGKVADNLFALVAAHPVEGVTDCGCEWDTEDGPAPCATHKASSIPQTAPARVEITDDAITAATDALNDEGGKPGHDLHSWRCLEAERYGPCTCAKETARLMLEAAVPFLQPQPVDRPLLDREAVAAVLLSFGYDVRTDAGTPAEMLGHAVDAVMELARPMPTQEQLTRIIEDTTREHLWDKVPGSEEGSFEFEPVAPKVAEAVLALLGGVDESEAGS